MSSDKFSANEAAESLIIEYNYEEISPEQLREYILLSMEEADRGYLLTTKGSYSTNIPRN
ncbi:MAG UNVERIFIED_CONTAM: hypothetical protein LVR29_09925 [Microcystis novacekii LVE1205-3]|jgi:hypothetical protein